MIFQRTLKSPVSIQGIGLHSGKPAKLTLYPSLPNTGIVFVRGDVKNEQSNGYVRAIEIPAHFRNIVDTQLATTLGSNYRGEKLTIATVEHVLAALAGLGVDNAVIEVDGPEVPILDGSSIQFVEAIQEVGLESQLQARQYVALRKRVQVQVAEKWAVAEPSSHFSIHASIEWDHPSIGYQEYHYVEGRTSFQELATARTFGFLRDVDTLKRMGLARGGSLDNAVVLDDVLVLNPEGLRSPDEFVRHKVLDAIGDFKLAGVNLQASFRLHRAGHDVHRLLLAAIFKDPANYQIVDASPRSQAREREMGILNTVARLGLASSF